MQKLLFIATLLLAITTYGQKLTEKVSGLTITNQEIASENDTIIKVIYKKTLKIKKKLLIS